NQNINTGWCGYGGDRGWGYAESPFGFAVAPNNSNKLLFSDFGFVHASSNGGVTWKQTYLNTTDQNPAGATTPVFKNYRSNGLENTSSWNMLWSDATHIFTAFSDINGIKSDNAGVSWKMAGATTLNSTYYFLKHPSNGKIYVATSTVHDMYQTTYLTDAAIDAGDGDIMFSTNNGTSWQQVHDFNHPVIWLALDPNNLNRMYVSVIHYANGVGEGGIWMTNDLQNNNTSIWTKLANPPRTQGHPLTIKVLNDGTLVCSYSGRRNVSGTFTNSSGIFKMNSGSSTWTDVSDAGMLYYTKDVVIDPHDAGQNKWYACVWSGWGGAPNGLGGLYTTTNRGQLWTKIFSGADRVSSITFSPTNANEVWMTTETEGLWHSTNINAATPSFSQITSYPFRQPERVFYNPYNSNELWVTSFGNGLKVATLTSTVIEEINSSSISLFPNPAKDRFRIQGLKFKVEKIEIVNMIGNKVMTAEVNNKPETEIDVKKLERGIYFVKLYASEKIVTKKIILE
ncbi:MAG: T9SS type A sorting domain-containing protein, partial [Bacteroidia bacterium]